MKSLVLNYSDPGDFKPELLKAISMPSEMRLNLRLNAISQLTIRLPRSLIVAFFKGTEIKFPKSVTIDEYSDESQLRTIFKGFMTSMSMSPEFLDITFSDALISLNEFDEPKIWEGGDLKQVFDELLENCFDSDAPDLKVSSNFTGDIPQIKHLTNMVPISDFEFIKKTAEQYGIYFFLDHISKTNTVNFFIPDYSSGKSPDFELDLEKNLHRIYTFKLNILGGFDKVQFNAADSEGNITKSNFITAEIDSLDQDHSKIFPKKVELRKDLKLSLESHTCDENASGQTAEDMAKGTLLNSQIFSDQIRFRWPAYYPVGSMFKIMDSDKHIDSTLVSGKYLVYEVDILKNQHGEIFIGYTGVRP